MDLTEEVVNVSEDTVSALKELGTKAQSLVDELTAKKKQSDEIATRLNQIQLELSGVSETAKFIIGREARKHSSLPYRFNHNDFTLVFTKEEKPADGNPEPKSEST